jgi:putative ABC transport system substrate-binding protein
VRRREFILLPGMLTACPCIARAQQPDRTKRLGVLMGYRESDREAQARLAAFFQVLEASGWKHRHNLDLAFRWAAGSPEQITSSASDLVRWNPDVVLAATTPVVRALLHTTRTIPIVFLSVSDPIGDGFVRSLSRPESNATGFTNLERSLSGKWLELVKELAPAVTRVAALFNPATAAGRGSYYWPPFEAAGSWSSVEPLQAPVESEADIEKQLVSLAATPRSGLAVMPDVFTVVNRARIISLAAVHRLPAVYPYRYFAEDGGVMSYGIDLADQYRRAARYVDRIFRGEKADELPVQGPAKFELVINQATAKALGLGVPPTLLARADEVIE